jgi:uncharacterized protein
MSKKKLALLAPVSVLVLLVFTIGPAWATGEPIKAFEGNRFIDLTLTNAMFLFIVGFIGGMVSGFIGSGGAFVLTPAMMSLGVPGAVAVASNMCHKFPKALVGAIKRNKYGQVDIKLGLTLGVSASIGVEIGIKVMQYIQKMWGEAGANLYVSVAYVLILVSVGGYVFYDAWKTRNHEGPVSVSKLALRLQKINIPPMVYFKTADVRISIWFTVPIGLATGMLAATIAVGGFIGVPGMIYLIGATGLVASATELIIAFVMGFVGSVEWGMVGMIDIRLTLIILAGSLMGIQIGAVGTTYIKEHMIKVVMGTIMLIVAFSRGFAIPKYTNELGLTDIPERFIASMSSISFYIMVFALASGALIIIGSLVKAMREKTVDEYQKAPVVSKAAK